MLLANLSGFAAMGIYAYLRYRLSNMVKRLPLLNRYISWENINMEKKETKAKNVTKKELMRSIESLDTNKVFDLVSLNRTNIANIKAIAELLKA